MSDFYEILGVPRDVSEKDLKSAYKKLARKYHPDNKETGNEDMFKKISEAYMVLSDPQKKASYDRVGHEAFKSGGAGAGAYSNINFGNSEIFEQFEDLFEEFFGGGSRRSGSSRNTRAQRRGTDTYQVINIDFLEAVFGVEKEIKIERLVTCSVCNGSGADPKTPPVTCPTCGGAGEVKQSTRSFFGIVTQITTCPTCRGTGKIIKNQCPQCKGKKFEKKTETLQVKIPKGVENGMKILLRGKGNDGENSGPAGDLYLGIKVSPHKIFQRDGLDIIQELNINIWQAILGDNIEIETVHGKQNIEIESGSQPDKVIRLKSKGIILDNGQKGDHYVKLNIIVPSKKDIKDDMLLNKLKEQKNKQKK